MKKVIILIFAFTYSFGILFAQNTPIGAPTIPSTPTVDEVSLPVEFTPAALDKLNFNRLFVPMSRTNNSGHAMFNLNPTVTATSRACKVATVYHNGWGQVVESISRGFDATGNNDIVSMNDLRASSESHNFIPYAAMSASTFITKPFEKQRLFFLDIFPDEEKMSYSKSVTTFPSNVPTTFSYSPGSSFVGCNRGTKETTTINDGTEGVIIYTVDPSTGATENSGTYAPGTLTVKVAEKPHDGLIREFIDKNGRVVCKMVASNTGSTIDWLATYYVYNELGKIVNVITPRGSKRLSLYGSTFSDAENLTYSYEYDEYGNVLMQKTPGETGANYTVYDLRNRPVLQQTPLLATHGLYQFSIYDSRGRIIINGLLTSSSSASDWQHWLKNPSSASYSPGSLLDIFLNGFTGAYPTSIPDCEIDQVNFYDDYVIPRTYNTSYSSATPTVGASFIGDDSLFTLTRGLLTGTITRIRDGGMLTSTNNWIASVPFYNRNGQIIQIQTLNPNYPATYEECLLGSTTADWDLECTSHDFAGNVVLQITEHKDHPNLTSETPRVLYKRNYFDYNNGGRPTKETLKINGGTDVVISEYKYDNLGQVSKKILGDQIEVQNYSYNIRGQLEAINKNYANSECHVEGEKASFGCIISYDFGFNKPRYDGSISGVKWRGKSHTMPLRSYGYEYDPAGRMTHAEYREYCGPSGSITPCVYSSTRTWNKTRRDYTVSGLRYDENGNILSMSQRGMDLTGSGSTAPVDIDKLTYAYLPWTNLLKGVTDEVTTDYKNGDFQDGVSDCAPIDMVEGTSTASGYLTAGSTSASVMLCPDYDYDADGNLIADKNKHIASIVYNDQDLPITIIQEHGAYTSTIDNVYTASGELVKKTVHYTAGSANTIAVSPVSEDYTQSYCGAFEYKNDSLQSLSHSEGRARYDVTTNLFTYDYFVKDHVGNIRSTVTGKKTNEPASATGDGFTTYFTGLELASATAERTIFAGIDNVRDSKPGTNDPADVMAARLNGSDSLRMIGPSLLLKVMPGDSFDITARCFYNDTASAGYQDAHTVMDALLATLSGMSTVNGVESGSKFVNGTFNNTTYDAYDVLLNDITDPTAPRAYINYLFFDENMEMRPEMSGAIQIAKDAGVWHAIGTDGVVPVLGSGHLLVYASGISSVDVFFDGITVHHYRGTLLEEQHYYPYGLAVKQDGIEPTVLANRNKYQGKEHQDELGLHLDDFHARQYDPQLGRFWGIDPMNQFPSGYTGMGNDPANNIDPTGCWTNQINFNPLAGRQTGQNRTDQVDNYESSWNQYEANCHGMMQDDMLARETSGETPGAGTYILLDAETLAAAERGEIEINPIKNFNLVDKEEKSLFGQILDGIQTAIDVVGFVPLVGDAADIVNGVIYTCRGDALNAGISFVAAVPMVGSFATGTRVANKAIKAFQKHHVIPTAVYRNLKRRGHIPQGWIQNNKWNLKKLEVPFHGSHNSYNMYVKRKIDKMIEDGDWNLQSIRNLRNNLHKEIDVVKENYDRLNDAYK